MQKPVHILNQRRNLTEDEVRNAGILQQSPHQRQLDAVVCLQHDNEVKIGVELAGWIFGRRSG
jgi:hypothetical protein